MLRALSLAIVFVVAASPTATLVCSTWCARGAQSHSGGQECVHEDSTTSMGAVAGDTCDMVVVATVFVPEHARRGVETEQGQAILVPRFQLAAPDICARPSADPLAESSLRPRPLSTVLRI